MKRISTHQDANAQGGLLATVTFQKEDDKAQANEDARQATLNADALNVITSDGTQDQVAALIQAGVPKDAVQRAIANAIAAIPVPADFNDFVSPDPM